MSGSLFVQIESFRAKLHFLSATCNRILNLNLKYKLN